jgi:hypothetical protein
VRRIAPTRAHPIVARRPPGNVLAALPLTLLDRCRDRVDAVRFRRGGAAALPLDSVSAALGRATRAIERLPGMKSGEDPATRVGRKRGSRLAVITTGAAVAGSAAAALMITRRRRVRVSA